MSKGQKKNLIISIIVICVLLGFIASEIFNSSSTGIQEHDVVKVDYQMWKSNKYREYDILNSLFDDIIWITVIPITENSTSGLILGLYNNLFSPESFSVDEFILAIDWPVIFFLISLFTIVVVLEEQLIFQEIARRTTKKFHTNTRQFF